MNSDMTTREESELEGSFNEYDYEDQVRALAAFLGLEQDSYEYDSIKDNGDGRYAYGNQEYLVLTDSEAGHAWDQAIEDYIDDVIRSEIPEQYRYYFDDDKFKRDASMDGRGHTLASYDGEENETDIDGTMYFLYRVN